MTKRLPCPPPPRPPEGHPAPLDALWGSLAQRRALRAYLQGLLLPRDRNKTLTALADAEPITGAQHREVQRLQWFVSESTWDHEQVNQQRIQLLQADPATRPHGRGVLVIDDTGDRKDGSATAHVARQYLGSVGKTDNGIVAVTSLWADARCYWPAHAVPYTPASRLPRGKTDPGFRTKPRLAADLVQAAQQAKIPFRAVVADCLDGDNTGFVEALGRTGVAFVLALKPRKGTWAPAEAAHTPVEAARELGWRSPRRPGQWRRIQRRFRDGHTQTWWAADAQLGGWGTQGPHRLVVATTDPARLPRLSTWYLLCNLARPASRRVQQAQLGEIVRLYGLRNWVEIVCTQVTKPGLGAGRGGRDHVADLHLAVGDHHPVDQQLHQLAALLEPGLVQAHPQLLQHGRHRVGDRAHLDQPLTLGGDLPLAGQQVRLLSGKGPVLALEADQVDHLGQVSLQKPLALACHARPDAAQGRLPAAQLPRHPAPLWARASAWATSCGWRRTAHRSAQTSSSSWPAGMNRAGQQRERPELTCVSLPRQR